jgi:hypothetical protein
VSGTSNPHPSRGIYISQEVREVKAMRKLGTIVSGMLLLATMAFAVPKPSTPDRPFPAVLKNARFVYVASYDGDQFNPNLFPQDRAAIASVEKSIREWGKLMVVTRPSDADIIILVQSRPSEDVLAVYDAHMSGGQYLWRTMGRDGLQTGETPMATQFEKGFESVQAK